MDCMYYGCIDMYLHVCVGISTYYVLVCIVCMACIGRYCMYLFGLVLVYIDIFQYLWCVLHV